MLSPEKKRIFDQFSRCEMGWHRAVREGGFPDYSVFLDEYFAAGYKYPIPNEEILKRDAEAFDSFLKAAREYDKCCDEKEIEQQRLHEERSAPKSSDASEA